MAVRYGYNGAQIALHWLIALAVLVNYLTGEGMEEALKHPEAGGGLHVWLGLTILGLAVIRILLRLVRGGPEQEPGPRGKAASALHGLLYLLMVAVPLGGSIAWFGGVEFVGGVHALAGNILILLAGVHALIGLAHHYLLKDDVLRRMMRPE
ncbi:cytochrome b [Rhodobacter sp. Har01]|uniref:cytochrome b n=1 Tax=Rhodobacter sp. Har01 TaxID=2883999 RepID=UPI001D06649B|nr:cytochrome b [Rhodobacter sp. Har01]MCB6179216.1 cytochrome b [Rhodobacter sp. Har01]